eukprot:7149359-Pyramimonas_sp.AAC.1
MEVFAGGAVDDGGPSQNPSPAARLRLRRQRPRGKREGWTDEGEARAGLLRPSFWPRRSI